MKNRSRNFRSRPGRRGTAPRRDPMIGKEVDVRIADIGARGDGLAETAAIDGKSVLVYVDGVLPGDEVRVKLRQKRGDGYGAEVLAVHARPVAHADAKCPHYEKCGGCSLQHVPDDDYRNWKRQRAVQAVVRAGVSDRAEAEMLVGALETSPPSSRRRADFSVISTQDGVFVGYAERFSHHIVNVPGCAVLLPEIVEFRNHCQSFLESLPRESAGIVKSIVINAADNGLDVVISASAEPDLDLRQGLAELAEYVDLARIAWKTGDNPTEPLAQRRVPEVHFAGVAVPVPAGGFLQATHQGETALTAAMADALAHIPARQVIDLFCGIGSFTFPLALRGDRRRVLAVEGDVNAVQALQYAVGRAAAPIEVSRRDLFRQPLDADDLKNADVVVFDPPRAGALAQCEILADFGPEWILAVSCNPATFARDIRLLRNGGYELQKVVPVDQFLWSAHLELFAVLRRALPAAA
ncbi:class I SAM-dependent RNA methyltransferase [Thalassospira sp. TSL5-1]|uniref:class I SAM-dependent RNA methyltransferase n=1 Tax=Thalassospira sp. TSL5-1 TaxID=1544451 RepID=UPI00093C99DD|nr:methyltransferase [Thalassospira sp. TSL5-1]OKH88837.1 SAM-dependent methyltransferase [Thalassospira sp. TSL5-1]